MKANNTVITLLPVLFGFFVMGFVDVVGISTNYVRLDFGLSDTVANLLPMMVFLWFALFSIPTGIWMSRYGRRNTVVVSLALTAAAMVIPFVLYNYVCVLAAFALLGIGNTMLQVSLNPMAASVVKPQELTSVLTMGQFIKAVSSFLGPIIAATTAIWFGDWKLLFIVYALVSLLAVVWVMTTIPADTAANVGQNASFLSTLSLCRDSKVRMLFLGILCIVGIDVGLNTSIPGLLMERLDVTVHQAGLGTSLYFAARTAGAFLGAIMLAKISSRPFLRVTMILAVAAMAGLMLLQTMWSMAAMIILLGLACSNVFSILFALALEYRPRQANEVSALMIMGVSGGALVTPCLGGVRDLFGQEAALLILLACILYIGYISLRLPRCKPLEQQ